MSNIRIDIASEFKDKGFKKADKAATGLQAQFDRLGKTVAAVFSVQQVTRFASAAVKGFAEDEKAATRFEQALKGINLGFATPEITRYLDSLESQSGVLKDDLLPAFQSLAQTTRSVYKSQDILNTAIDASAGSGYDLNTIIRDLTRSYLGNNAGLAKYNLGLSKAELKTTSFEKVQELLNKQFSGQRAAYLQTYAGKVDLITVSYDRMSDAIGEGLVDAFGMLAGESGIGGATTAMEKFGVMAADAIRGVGVLVSTVQSRIPFLDQLQYLSQFPQAMKLLDKLMGLGRAERPLFFPTAGIGQPGVDKRLAAIEEAAIKRQKELEALRLKALREQEKANRLKRISIMLMEKEKKFDLTRIQLQAALQGKLTSEEENRVKELMLIEETKQAIAEQNVDKAEELMEKLQKLQDETTILAGKLTEFPKANDPFKDWTTTLTGITAQLAAIAQKKIVVDFIAKFTGSELTTAEKEIAKITSGSKSDAEKAAEEAKKIAEEELRKAEEAAAAARRAEAEARSAEDAAKAEEAKKAAEATKAAAEAAKKAAEEAARAAEAAKASAITEEEKRAADNFAEAAKEASNAADVLAETIAVAEYNAALTASAAASSLFDESFIAASSQNLIPDVTINVNVEGNVTAEEDLSQKIYDTFLGYQKSGKGLIYQAVAI